MMIADLSKRAALGLLWVYKRTLSPAFYFLGARCRHVPSCSDYAADAFRHYGPWQAFWLSVSRFSRCHPWGSSGIDPVPARWPVRAPESPTTPWWQFWRLGDWAWTERCGRRDGGADLSDPGSALDEQPGL